MTPIEFVCAAALISTLVAGIRWPGALMAGSLFTYQTGALSGIPMIGTVYVAAAALIAVGRYLVKPQPLRLTSPDIALFVLLLILLASTQWAPFPDDAMEQFVRLIESVLGMYAIARLGSSEGEMQEMVVAATFVGAILCYGMLSQRAVDDADALRLYLVSGDASAVGLSAPLPFAMLAATTLIYFSRKPLVNATAAAALALIAYTSLVSATRSVFLAYAVGLLAMMFLARKQVGAHRYMVTAMLLIAGVAVAVSLMPEKQIEHSITRLFGAILGSRDLVDASTQERIYAWSDAWEIIVNHPFLGLGYGSFASVSFIGYPHNMFLEITAAAGMLGLLALLAWLVMSARRLVRCQRQSAVYGAILIGFACVAFTQMQVSFAFFMARPLFLFGAIAARHLPSVRQRIRRPVRRVDLAISAVTN